jgi:hypothetical protein
MNLGDDISNLLRNLGTDAGVYQDLTQYNAAQVARRRLPPTRTAAARQAQDPSAPSSLTSILQRLASPADPATPVTVLPTAVAQVANAAGQPPRLDRLFDRLATPGPTTPPDR